MKRHPDNSDSLEWLAFQYIADELSPDERSAFELRLGEDQAAREAVAAAVELTMVTQLVFADDAANIVARNTVQKSPARQGWWSVALACGGLLALVVMNQVVWQPRAGVGSSELANAWIETREAFPTSAAAMNEDEPAEVMLDEESDLDLPTWMLAAVSTSNTNMNMSETMNMPETQPGDMIPE